MPFVSDNIYVQPVYQVDESNVKSIVSEKDLSPSIIEEQKLVINQLRNALRSEDSIAINKVVLHILHSH
ncbi:MAG: hypothetical protein IIB71_04235 [Proteobacteria bacterium]|nr:hypothetical protein [Pseudomonadota bacterium]